MNYAKKKPGHLCPVSRCRRNKGQNKKLCHRHHAQNQKENNLVGYTYCQLKQNAKRRNKVFTITVEDFREFCTKTNYLYLKGRTKNKMSIDRINPNMGYEKGNLQILSVSDNAAKQHLDSVPF